MKLGIAPVVSSGFALEPVDAKQARFKFSGNGDMAALSAVEAFLSEVHDYVTANGFPVVEVDLLELYFMNSSCLKLFVSWIHSVDQAGVPYTIHFFSSARLHWQHRSLATLQRLAPKVVTTETSS